MPHDPEPHRTSSHPSGPHPSGPHPPDDPSGSVLPSLAVIALIEGALARGLVADRDEAVGAALTAALTLAIETHGAGRENEALTHAEAIFRHLAGAYRVGIADGRIRGRSRGGFERNTADHHQQQEETSP